VADQRRRWRGVHAPMVTAQTPPGHWPEGVRPEARRAAANVTLRPMPGGPAARHRWRVTTDHSASGGPQDRNGQPWWLRPQVWAALLIVAAIGMAMLLTACDGSSSPATPAQSKNYQKALAFVQCMRAHGEPAFPDPTSQGIVSDSQANLNSPVLLAAARACGSLLPPGSLQLTEAQQEQLAAQALRHAECMRAHGVTNFPDPPAPGQQGPPPAGIDPNSPVFRTAVRACEPGLGPGPRRGG
jgi:hypothetical protein